MIQKAMNQLLFEVSWPKLDVLVLDLPPGTGDVQLTITQSIELAGRSHAMIPARISLTSSTGAVIVSTPQDLALRDAVRGVKMFNKVNVPILGMVQNMSTFTCTNCGHNHDIFGLDGAKKKCGDLGIHFLGDIPLHPSICSDADAGKPTMVASPEGPQAQAFAAIARELTSGLSL